MRKLVVPIFGLFILLAAAVGATQAQVPSKMQAAIFFKILKYDKNTASRSKGTISMVILLEGSATGRKSELVSGFGSINGQTIEGATIKVSAVTVANADKVQGAIQAAAGNIVYLPLGVTAATSAAVIAHGKANKIPVLTDDPALSTQGAAVCLVLEGTSPKMVINLPASQAQGMALSADVLKLAKVIR
ncbi:MAG: YfiR family protein [Myxococcota bacterium]|jgi:hypothetical protein|nr:YfiR family protein [Myxococcota bacterium]